MPKLNVFVALLAVLVIGAGCASSPRSRFYTLDVAYEGSGHPIGEHRLGVGPFEMPSYLDRPQIVIRGEGNQLVISDFDRWADSLPERFEAVLVRNLVIAGGSPAVLSHPWRRGFNPTFRVTGVVDRFEAGADGSVVLEVRWAVLDGDESEIQETFRSVYTEQAAAGDYGSISSAMSRAVAAFAADIVTQVAAEP